MARATGQAIDEAFVAANLADALHRAGRSREGLAAVIAAEAGLGRRARAPRAGSAMQRAEIEFELGRLGRRRGAPAAPRAG